MPVSLCACLCVSATLRMLLCVCVSVTLRMLLCVCVYNSVRMPVCVYGSLWVCESVSVYAWFFFWQFQRLAHFYFTTHHLSKYTNQMFYIKFCCDVFLFVRGICWMIFYQMSLLMSENLWILTFCFFSFTFLCCGFCLSFDGRFFGPVLWELLYLVSFVDRAMVDNSVNDGANASFCEFNSVLSCFNEMK